MACHATPDRAPDCLTAAQVAVEVAVQHGPARSAHVAESFLLAILALHATRSGDIVAALGHIRTSMEIERTTDFYSPHSMQAGPRFAAVCQIILGMPAQAIDTLAELGAYGSILNDGTDVRALAHLELGNIDAAMPYLRSHVANSRTGRFPGQANDSVLLLAALACSEGDTDLARELLLQSWFCRTDATIIFSHALARRLDVVDEHERCQRRAVTFGSRSPEGINGMHLAMAALRSELTRRGWD